ncbi:MAG: helix-turn-helix domain-containing protein [Kofleriaceae bacterium]
MPAAPRALTDAGPARGVVHADAAPGHVAHRRVTPTDALAEVVAHCWWVEWDLAAPFVAETLPHPCVHLVFERSRGTVTGVATARFERRLTGRGHVFGVKFRPAGFTALHDTSLAALTDRVTPLPAVLGPAAAALARAIEAAPDLAHRVAAAEAFLVPRARPLTAAAVELRDLTERLAIDASLRRVDDLAALVGVTPRTLERRFRALIGVGPKWVIRRYRLHEAAARLGAPAAPSIAAVAAELGYADQAHFARDFKGTVGCAPSAYVARFAR